MVAYEKSAAKAEVPAAVNAQPEDNLVERDYDGQGEAEDQRGEQVERAGEIDGRPAVSHQNDLHADIRGLLLRCPLCNGTVAVRWPGVNVWRCRSCGLLMRNPAPGAEELERLYARSWSDPQTARAETGGTTERLARLYVARLLKTLGLGSAGGLKVLEYGAGRGEMLAALRDKGAEVWGVEPFGAGELRRRGFAVYAGLQEVPRDMRFDGVVTVDVVEHVARPWEELATLKGLLRPGGFLYVSTMNAHGLNALLSRSRWREVRKHGHLFFFTPSTLRRVLRECRFETARRLRWHVRYHTSWPRKAFDLVLQSLGLDGEIRFLARSAHAAR